MNINLMFPAIIIVISLFILGSLYSVYVGVIKKRNKVQEAFFDIDAQLKKRYDLIPNILTIAKKFMEHERGLIEDVTKLRVEALNLANGYNEIGKKIKLDKEIAGKLGQLFVSVENYPQLKSDQTMMEAMKAYQDVEEHIAAARRFYNAAVLDLKNAVEIFPSSLIAGMLGIGNAEFFQAEEHERQPISAQEFFNK